MYKTRSPQAQHYLEGSPHINELDVFNQIRKSKKPNSRVPGDLPRTLMQEFAPELAGPLSRIYRNVVDTGEWPSAWHLEHGIPLQKNPNPKNEDDLRVISLTAFYSKVLERFVMDWLLEHIGHLIDWHQYGGQKGTSVSHYLIDFVNFVLYNQDLKNIHAVLAATEDFSKAFNRQNHNLLITLLSELGVPGWLLRIVIGFLQNRELEVKYKGVTTDRFKLPGGGPQGTILGMFLFLILINAAGFREAVKNTGQIITKQRKREAIEKIHLKFIDDMTAAEAINVKEKLVPNPNTNPERPLGYHERTGHVLGEGQSEVQALLAELKDYTEEHEMKINTDKCKVMLFNTSKTYDFLPKIGIEEDDPFQVVDELRLLGVMITSNLSWQTQVDYMCKRAFARVWMIRRLKPLGATNDELMEVYRTQIRCLLEFAVAVWNSGLTKAQINQIERVQKCVLAVILDSEYLSYNHALEVMSTDTLSDRRHNLCFKFAVKAQKHEKFSNWFSPYDHLGMDTRSKKDALKPVQARTNRFAKSPIAYLTDLLNQK